MQHGAVKSNNVRELRVGMGSRFVLEKLQVKSVESESDDDQPDQFADNQSQASYCEDENNYLWVIDRYLKNIFTIQEIHLHKVLGEALMLEHGCADIFEVFVHLVPLVFTNYFFNICAYVLSLKQR